MAGAKVIKQLLIEKGMTVKELADKMEILPQSMSNKLFRNTFTAEELLKISKILGCELVIQTEDTKKRFIIED